MTDLPTLFNGAMVRAMLDGRKTQTRRVLKPQPKFDPVEISQTGANEWLLINEFGNMQAHLCPPYAIGDRILPAMEIPSLNRNYCADTFGKIWSRAVDGETWLPLAGGTTSKGYLSVTPAHDGKYKTRAIHRLVAEAFYGFEPDGLKQVRHLDGDRLHNAPENLDWGTQEDNWSDRNLHGRGNGEDHHAAKLTEKDVAYIRGSDRSQRELARHFSVRQSTIWQVKNNLSWRTNQIAAPPNQPRWASRLTLTVTDVRVQRVQAISEADAIAEGVEPDGKGYFRAPGSIWYPTAIWAFRHLWDSINAERGYGWNENPWVAAYTFTVEKRNIDA